MQLFQEIIIAGVKTSPLELFGVVSGLWCVYLTVRQNIWCWPIGIVAAIASGVLFHHTRLYADMWLQGFFIVTSGYGWVWWLRGGLNHSTLPVSLLPQRQRIWCALLTGAAILTVGALHARYTNARFPFIDAAASGASVTAQLLMMRKKIECWPMWIAIDGLSIGIYLSTNLYAYALQYALFLILALLGWLEWKEAIRKRNPTQSQPLPRAI